MNGGVAHAYARHMKDSGHKRHDAKIGAPSERAPPLISVNGRLHGRSYIFFDAQMYVVSRRNGIYASGEIV